MPGDGFLQVERLSKSFAGRAALRDVSFCLGKGRALGVVGPSGSGKSTLARCLAGFERADGGSVLLEGSAPRTSDVQLIFQEAAASLNPGFRAWEAVAEPLAIRRTGTAASRRKAAADWMETVGLPRPPLDKPALAFSGGERQRLAIARALAAGPKVLILDESLSGLDVVLQAQMIRLLRDLRAQVEITAILITHDVALAGRISDEIAVMDEGRIVEQAAAEAVFAAPAHPRTREMLAASRALSLEGALS
jgi:ABC-type dipeptide/oligopeptide/nickel transport system ATPase subunit